MAWIELHQALPTHKKTRRLTRALGLSVPKDIPQVVGHLCVFWLWCIDNTASDGGLDGLDAQDIADAAGWTDDPEIFLAAMVEAGFIDNIDNTNHVHDWDDYIGRLLAFRTKEKERNREKQRRYRERQKALKSEAAKAPEPEPKEDIQNRLIDPEWMKVVNCYEENIGLLPVGLSAEMLQSYVDDLSADVVCEAIKITNTANPDNPWKYLKAILDKWAEKGITTPEKAAAYTKDLERRLKDRKSKQQAKNDENGPPAISGGFY